MRHFSLDGILQSLENSVVGGSCALLLFSWQNDAARRTQRRMECPSTTLFWNLGRVRVVSSCTATSSLRNLLKMTIISSGSSSHLRPDPKWWPKEVFTMARKKALYSCTHDEMIIDPTPLLYLPRIR